MTIPNLKIGDLIAKIPIIQGGMGIGVSRSNLASAVANEGGIGIISGVQIGFEEPDFIQNPLKANIRALKNEIRKAREKSPNGIIGVNLMVAMKNYEEYVLAAVKEKIDVIISGAGLPIDLPQLVKDSSTKIVPIVSSAKAAKVILKRWLKHDKIPDAVIVEGPLAGGHLGFKAKELIEHTHQTLEDIVKEVIDIIKPYEQTYNKEIPVIAAGGVFDGNDINRLLSIGAKGVQMGTRFVTTDECDADYAFKETYVNAQVEDVELIQSPVGLPGRAIRNNFIEETKKGKLPVKRCYQCLHKCNPADTPYCISDALIDSAQGKNGLVFSGARVGEIKGIVSVKELITSLKNEMLGRG